MPRADVLISVPELSVLLGEPGLPPEESAPVLLDVRWTLGEERGAGHQRYLQGHLPGALFLDLETVLTTPGLPTDGRHPLPSAATLAAGLGALGVSSGSRVVVYDEAGSFAAGRAWWVLRWAGLDVRVLDGGIGAWQRAGLPLAGGEVTADPVELTLTTGQLPTIDADEAADFPYRGVLVDVRGAARFRGEVEPIDPRAGHIPGAINLPFTLFFAADGSLPAEELLRERLAPLDHRPVTFYCGSGVSAAQAVLAAASLGIEAAIFPGSWSAWSNDPDRPAEVGEA